MLATLALALVPVPPQDADGFRFYDVPLPTLVDDLPGAGPASTLYLWGERYAFWPVVVLDGDGRGYYVDPVTGDDAWAGQQLQLAGGRLVVAVPASAAEDDVTGTVYLPQVDGHDVSLAPYPFTLTPDLPGAPETAFQLAELAHLERLLDRGVAGAAWFRHRRDALRETLGDQAPEPTVRRETWQPFGGGEGTLEDTFALFLGGRALSENLQLDRLLPDGDGDGQDSVPVDSLEGIQIRAFDWAPLLEEEPPLLDSLAALVPADQHALFFPTFEALSAHHDELTRGETILAALDSQGAALAAVRDRYERQLALPWNALVRTFGERAVRSVAVTGSDAYLPSGTDLAVLFETTEPAALLALLENLRAAAAPEQEVRRGAFGTVQWSGVETPGRTVSSYSAALDGAVLVTNSLVQLERVAAVADGAAPTLAEVDEYRFFRQRYRLDAPGDRALLVIPDEAIRRWCGPRWRIAASRRVRAAAVLADLTAQHLDALVDGRQVRMMPDERFPLGGQQLAGDAVVSNTYGSLRFLTPIAELPLVHASRREAELYQAWKDGYERNWSRAFDPIAVEAVVGAADGGLVIDLTVLPLIDFTDYRELARWAGDARLAAGTGDPHPEALTHFVVALDTASEEVRELGTLASALLGVGDAVGWVGDFAAVYVDRDDELLADLGSGRPFDVEDELNRIPLALHVDVSSGLKLAAFLAGLRAMVEGAAPGLVQWHPETEGEQSFVRVTTGEELGTDFSLYYGTTPDAWIVSLHRATLVRALARQEARASDPAGPAGLTPDTPWTGRSAGLSVERDALLLLDTLYDGELRDNLRRLAWDQLPILNEWRARDPAVDPVAFHATYWGEELTDPAGGELVWDASIGSFASTTFGAPAAPRGTAGELQLPPDLAAFTRLTFTLEFEHDGLRARASLAR